ncbi:MAG TPA: hypothetical protein PLS56_02805 [Candidatus Dojkabacteria bacterium]|nr:hypothetical protein [Candidatus Dojkabacteria bacterium]
MAHSCNFVRKFLNREDFLSFAKLFGLHVIITAGLIYIISILQFYLGVEMNFVPLTVGFLIASYLVFFLPSSKKKNQHCIIYFVFTLLLYLLAIWVSFCFYDISWDGQEYHQETIFAIVDDHWNPIRNFNPPNGTFPNLYVWVKHYPKASEILSSSIYTITGRIESAKAFNLLFIASSFCLSLYFLSKELKLNFRRSLLFSFLVAFNPVSVYQSLTFYLDGEISSLIICGFILIVMLVKSNKRIYLYTLMLLITLLVNFKTTGIIFSVFLCLEYILLLFVNKYSFREVFKRSVPLLLTGICAICVFGFNPYVYNTIHFKNPAYPLVGEDSADIMSYNRPEGYEKLNKGERMFVSYFLFGIDSDTGKIKVRLPFSFNYEDVLSIRDSDPRIGGFGPFFMEICILSGMSLLYLLRQKKFSKTGKCKLFLYCFSICLLIFVMPESWWARYVPLAYLVPIIIGVFFVVKNKHVPFVVELLIFLLFLNNLYVGMIYSVNPIRYTREINGAIQELKNRNEKVYVYRYGEFHNNVQRLKENGIEYEVVEYEERWNSLGEGRMVFYNAPFEIKYEK